MGYMITVFVLLFATGPRANDTLTQYIYLNR